LTAGVDHFVNLPQQFLVFKSNQTSGMVEFPILAVLIWNHAEITLEKMEMATALDSISFLEIVDED